MKNILYFMSMQNTTIFFDAPQTFISRSSAYKFIKLFKYELIKVLVFLLLFFASLFYVNEQSNEYYRTDITVKNKIL